MLNTKKNVNQKVRYAQKESEKNIEHFANPKKKKNLAIKRIPQVKKI